MAVYLPCPAKPLAHLLCVMSYMLSCSDDVQRHSGL